MRSRRYASSVLRDRPRSTVSQLRNSSTSSGSGAPGVAVAAGVVPAVNRRRARAGRRRAGPTTVFDVGDLARAHLPQRLRRGGAWTTVMCRSSGPCRSRPAGCSSVARKSSIVASVMPADGGTRAGARARRPGSRPPRPAPAAAVSAGGLTLDVAHARRDLEQISVEGGAVLVAPARSTALPSASKSSGTTATAPGDARRRARSAHRRAPRTSAATSDQIPQRWMVRSPRRRNPTRGVTPRSCRRARRTVGTGRHGVTERQEVRVASLAARQRGADELAEERVGPVGTALELGVGLRADPERVLGQLDELDQPAVRGQCREQHEAAVLEAAAVGGVELVAVAVALGHDRLAVGLGTLEPGLSTA